MPTRRFISLGSAAIAAVLVQAAPAAFAMGAGNNSLHHASGAQPAMVATAATPDAVNQGCHSITTAGGYRLSVARNTQACVVVAGSVIWIDGDGTSGGAAQARIAVRGNGGHAGSASHAY